MTVMGLFWESRKTKEQKEEQMLSAILKQFESELGQVQKKNVSAPSGIPPVSFQKNPSSPQKNASIEDLVRFLSSKGLFEYKEWEDFQTKKNG